MKDLEHIYDTEINPLMAQIIDVCKQYVMPFFAMFQCNDDTSCKSAKYDGEAPLIYRCLEALSQCNEENGVNVDKWLNWVARSARETGHSSIYLSRLGIPEKVDAP